MVVAFVKSHTLVTEKVLDTSIDLTVATTVPAGNLIVAAILYDNAATVGKPTIAAASSIARMSGETNSWVLLGRINHPSSTSIGAFAGGELWAIKTTVAWSAANYVATLDTAVTMKATVLAEFSGAEVTARSTAGTAYSTTTTAASAATTGTTPVIGDLALGFLFGSNIAVAPAGDTDTTGGSWSTAIGVGSTGGSAATNNFGIVQYKVLTAASAQTYNSSAAGAAGNGAIVTVLQATPTAAITQANVYPFYTEGTETGSTALGNSQAIDLTSGDANMGVRIRLQSTTSVTIPATDDWQLQWEKNASGTWTDVTTSSSTVSGYASPNLTDGGATTKRLSGGTGTFEAGKISETGLVSDLGWAGLNHTEVLYAVTIKKADFTNFDTLRFRVLRNGVTTTMTYSFPAAATIFGVTPFPSITTLPTDFTNSAWVAHDTAPTITTTRISCPPAGASGARTETTWYDFTGRRLSVRIAQSPTAGTAYLSMYVPGEGTLPAGRIGHNSTAGTVIWITAITGTTGSTTWDPSKPYLSIREDSGTLYYERSATGAAGTWELLASLASYRPVTGVRVDVNTVSTASSTQAVWYEEVLGSSPSTGTTHSASASLAATATLTTAASVTAGTRAKIDTLSDDFSTKDTTKWTWGASATQGSGLVSLPANAFGFAQSIESIDRFDLTNSSITIRVPSIPTRSSGTGPSLTLSLISTANQAAASEQSINLQSNMADPTVDVYPMMVVGGTPDYPVATSRLLATYRWWRIAHNGTNVVFTASADGVTYDSIYSVAASTLTAAGHTLSDLRVAIRSVGSVGGSTGAWTLDWVNVAGVTHSATASLAGTATLSTTAAVTRNATASLAVTASPTAAATVVTPHNLSALIEDFTLTSIWDVDPLATATTTSATIPATSAQPTVSTDTSDWSLDEQRFFWRWSPPPAVLSATASAELQPGPSPSSTNMLRFFYDNGTLFIRHHVASTVTTLASYTWNPASPYLAFRDTGTTQYWETSADGTNWTTVGSAVTGLSIGGAQVIFRTNASGTSGFGNLVIDKVNTALPAGTTHSATAALAVTATGSTVGALDLSRLAVLATTATTSTTAAVSISRTATAVFTAALTTTGATDRPTTAARTTTATLSTGAGIDRPVSGNLPVTAALVADASVSRGVSGSLPVTAGLATVGLASDAALASRSIAVSLATSADMVRVGISSLALTADRAAVGGVDRPSAASLPVTVSSVATPLLERGLVATYTGTATLLGTPAIDRPITATQAMSATLSTAASVDRAAVASLPVTASRSSTANRDTSTTAALNLLADLATASGASSRDITATLTSTATLLAAQAVDRPVTGTRAVLASLATSAAVDRSAAATLAATATPVAAASRNVTATTALNVTADLQSASGASSKSIDGLLPVTASRAAALGVDRPVTGTLPVTATLAAVCAVDRAATAVRSVTASLVTAGLAERAVSGSLAVTASRTAAAQSTGVASASASLLVIATPIALAGIATDHTATRTVTATLSASAEVQRAGVANRPVTASLSASMQLVANATAHLPVTAARPVVTQVLDWWEADLQFEFAAALLASAVVLRVDAPSTITVPTHDRGFATSVTRGELVTTVRTGASVTVNTREAITTVAGREV